MKKLFPLLILVFTMCNSQHLPAQNFSGSYKGEQAGISSSAVFSVKDQQLTGTIIVNGKTAQVTGTVNESLSEGTVYDNESQKDYAYSGKLSANELRFSITFPELNNQAVDLVMQRVMAKNEVASKNNNTSENRNSNKPTVKNNVAKNPALIGVWRHTELISSGSGDYYASFSTDYFLEFKSDGTFLSWTGKSAGSGYESNGQSKAKADKGEWYTEGKNLYMMDPARNEKASTLFYAEAGIIMLHNGGEQKRIYQRVE